MSKTNLTAGERTQITTFAHYKGHVIDVEQAGHPQAQNIYIDGQPAGYVIFPTGAIATARSIIDTRLEIADRTQSEGYRSLRVNCKMW